MMALLQVIRSIVFTVIAYGSMPIVALVCLPWALLDRRGAFAAAHIWCRIAMWCARWIVGLKTEVRGTPPKGGALVVGKHQSFLDIIMIFAAIPRGKFIMKKELIYTPVVGQYGLMMGCIPVDRGKRGAAIKKMKADVAAGRTEDGQLIIFPQGTRVPPGEKRPYKIGTAVLYEQLEQDCYPVAVNVGLFWPAHGLVKKPGTAVIEFLPPIAPGKSTTEFMAELEAVIEAGSDRLMAEARG